MITEISFIQTTNQIPYNNIAMEEFLMMDVKPEECIFYLWQNKHTVVIGRNQNAWKECKVTELEGDGGYLARRLSGGGAVFHDLGNLNFTFLVREENYDLDRQMEVILRAVQKLGIKAEKSGRNDITVDGFKFSGNAFYTTKGHSYHHGTILFDVDKENLSKYLNVDASKLKSKGIESVRSRIANLRDFNPDITLEMLSEKLIESFDEVYGGGLKEYDHSRLDMEKIDGRAEMFGSWDWLYGSPIKFSYEISQRFSWGDIQIQLEAAGGKIVNVVVYSDSLDPDYILEIPKALKDIRFLSKEMAQAVREIPTGNPNTEAIANDIVNLLLDQNL